MSQATLESGQLERRRRRRSNKWLALFFLDFGEFRIDDIAVIRLLLTYFFYFFHQFLYWVLVRGLLGKPVGFEWQRTLVLGILNAAVGVALFHFLDRLKEPA